MPRYHHHGGNLLCMHGTVRGSAAYSPPPSTVHERLQASVTATKHVALRHCGTGAGARLLTSRIAGLQVLCSSMACVHAVINSVKGSTLLCLCWLGEGGDRDTQRSGTGGVAGGSPLRCGGEGTQRRAQVQLPDASDAGSSKLFRACDAG
jgi:hypothetical protein